MTTVGEIAGWAPGHELAVVLGWTLLHFCWQGLAVAVGLWCVLGLLNGRSAKARYGLTCLALGLMVALPLITFGRLAAEARHVPSVGPAISFDMAVTVDAAGAQPAVPLKERVGMWLDEAAPWVPAVWLVGVVLFLARLNLGLMVARRMKWEGTEPAAAELQVVVRGLAGRLGVSRAVKLLHSAVVQAPTVIGWLKPVVLLPVECFTGLSETQIEALLAHELAHIRRHDYLVSVAQSVVEALLFYHPAVWWVSRQVRRERECCCDEMAVGIGGDRLAYAKALSWLEERRTALPEIVLGANGGVLTMRIRRLLGYRESSVGARVAASVLLGSVVMVGGAYLVTVARAELRSVPSSPAETATASGDPVASSAGAPVNVAGDSADAKANRQNSHAGPAAGVEGDAALGNLPLLTQGLVRQVLEAGKGLGPEDERRLQEALLAAAKVSTPEFTQRLNEAMGPELRKTYEDYARAAAAGAGSREALEQLDAKLNSPEFKKQMAEAMTAAASTGSPEFREKLDEARKAIDTLSTPEYRKKVEELALAGALFAQANGTPETLAGPDPLKRRLSDSARMDAYKTLGMYGSWLNQDVVWIITAQERDAFKLLTNDEERDTFISQFWERRNPTPGAATNSFKDEHYARITYANERFGAADVPGWKTDRGHIYIAYGKPDSIDSHPGGGEYQRPNGGGSTETYPFEVWHYRSIPGIGENLDLEFVDTCRCGSYHYTIDRTEKDLLKGGSGMAGAVESVRAPGGIAGFSAASAKDADSGRNDNFVRGANVREVTYKGLDSVTLAEVGERFKREGIEIHVGMPYDRAVVARAAAELKKLLVEHGRSSATIMTVVGPMRPGVGLAFVVKEGPAGKVSEVGYRMPGAASQADAGATQGNGAIEGVVMDKTGAVLARVSVTAVNTDTGAKVTSYSDAAGKYSIAPLAAGPYNVVYEIRGFARLLQEKVLVDGKQPVGLNVKLGVGGANMTLTVTAPPLAVSIPAPASAAVVGGSKPAGPQRVSSGSIMGVLISKVDPVYPAEARAKNVQGAVVLHVVISKAGTVEDVRIISGPKELLVSAIDAVRQWKYKPYLLNGEPTDVDTIVTMNFSLAESTGAGGMQGQTQTPGGDSDERALAKQEMAASQYYALVQQAILAGQYREADVQLRRLLVTFKDSQFQEQFHALYDEVKAHLDQEAMDRAKANQDGPTGIVPKRIGKGVSAPVILTQVQPELTAEAKAAKFGGIVTVNVWVDEHGDPTHVRVTRGIGKGLDEKAVEAVKQWKFRPAMEDGKPVAVEIDVEVLFRAGESIAQGVSGATGGDPEFLKGHWV